jgi:hypothetical protein
LHRDHIHIGYMDESDSGFRFYPGA